jgi:FMN-dependent NADH-azoreductase
MKIPTLLHIDASPLGDASISRQLSREFVQRWREANPGGKVLTRDLNAAPIPPISAGWVGASFTPEEARTPAQRELLAISDRLLAELESADEYVFGVPMHNFGVPSVLKLWIDQIVRAGKTFAAVDGVPSGLLKNKRATFLIASGGMYREGSAMASFNFVEPYLRTIFGFVGVTDVSFLAAGGAAAVSYGKIDRESFLRPHLETISGWFQPVAA